MERVRTESRDLNLSLVLPYGSQIFFATITSTSRGRSICSLDEKRPPCAYTISGLSTFRRMSANVCASTRTIDPLALIRLRLLPRRPRRVPSSLPPEGVLHRQVQLDGNTSFEAEHEFLVFAADVNPAGYGPRFHRANTFVNRGQRGSRKRDKEAERLAEG